MKKYARISCDFVAQGATGSLKNDAEVSEELTRKLETFIKKEKIKNYRIINAETVQHVADELAPAYKLVCLHLEYEI